MNTKDLKLQVTACCKIKKFKKGQNPETDEPYETVEHTQIFVGEEAERILKNAGGEINAID